MNAIGLNNNAIHYSWYLNYSLNPNRDSPQFFLRTEKLELGEHQLSVVVADSFSSSQATWHVKVVSLSSVEGDGNGIPTEYQLFQNYPNPFNPATTIRFALPKAAYVKLQVFDVQGKEITTLVSQDLNAGYYATVWHADVPSGTYIFRLQARQIDGGKAGDASTGSARGFVETKKMILLK
jgi:hypothetical protein